MALLHDISSESHTGTTGSASEGSFNWIHPGAASGVKGVLIFTFVNVDTGDLATSVSYGGVNVPPVVGGRALDATNESGDCKAWFLGTGIPQGSQPVVVNRTNNASVMYAVCCTQVGTQNAEVTGVFLHQDNQALSEVLIDDGSPGLGSTRYGGLNSGASTLTAGANSTITQSILYGVRSAGVVVENAAGQGSRPIGWSMTTDDVAAVYLATRYVFISGTPPAAPSAVLIHKPIPPGSATVTLGWTASPSPNVGGYELRYGLISGFYTMTLDVGNVTQTTVTGLVSGTTYYWVVRAYSNGSPREYSTDSSELVAAAA